MTKEELKEKYPNQFDEKWYDEFIKVTGAWKSRRHFTWFIIYMIGILSGYIFSLYM
jgi:hypothetical protein